MEHILLETVVENVLLISRSIISLADGSLIMYNTSERGCVQGPPMIQARQNFGLATLGDSMLACGGSVNGLPITSCEHKYYVFAQWLQFDPLPTAVRAPAMCTLLDTTPHVFGGLNASMYHTHIQNRVFCKIKLSNKIIFK
jgi:hypothetical protein